MRPGADMTPENEMNMIFVGGETSLTGGVMVGSGYRAVGRGEALSG